MSVKFGAVRGPEGSWLGMDTRPTAVKNFLAYSLTRLGLDHVDIARIEEAVPPSSVAGTRYDEHQMRILDAEQ